MDEVTSTRRSPKPFFTAAAWLSFVVPLLAAGWVYSARTIPNPRLSETDLVVLALVFGSSFVAGCVSLWGVRTNGARVILPPALLGILVSSVLEVLALFFLVISGMPTN